MLTRSCQILPPPSAALYIRPVPHHNVPDLHKPATILSTIFEPKLELPLGAVAPDSFDESLGAVPPDDFVVSRDRAGLPKSVFGDLVWDFTAYNAEGILNRIHFAFWTAGALTEVREQLCKEIRQVVFALIWRREGAPLSTGTLRNYVSVLSALAGYAEGAEARLETILGNEQLLTQFCQSGCSGWMVETLSSLLTLLVRIGATSLGFDLVSDKTIMAMKRKNKEYRAGIKQHPPIPTRIYSHLISSLQAELTAWKAVEENLLNAVTQCGADPRAGRSLARQKQIGKKHGLAQESFFVLEDILSESASEYFLSRAKKPDLGCLSTLVGGMQLITKIIVQTFTGMRDDEALSLPYDCLSTSDSNGKIHYLVTGRTTKFAHGLVKRTQWVTNREGHDAILAAQRIAMAIYAVFGVTPVASTNRLENYPLFVSVGYMNFAGLPQYPENGHFIRANMAHRELPEECFLILEDQDLHELEQIDPHRAWRSEAEFKLNERWVFTTHQLRRSLALYAQRSGLVSLPSLRRQLKHITEEMSRYYARGSAYAVNFINGDKRHFGLEWQATQPESSALSYILNVVLSDEELFGGHASWVQHRLKGKTGSILANREMTLRQFKKGELAYRETIIGGCTNTGSCDKVAVRWLHVDCIRDNCKNLVGSVPKLNRKRLPTAVFL